MTDSSNSSSQLNCSRSIRSDRGVKEETELIKKYESLTVLWDTTHNDYNNKYIRHEALKQLLEIYRTYEPDATLYHIRTKINSLRSNYRKELKKYISSKRVGTDGSEYYTYVPSNWKFYALRFLGGDAEISTSEQMNMVEINMDEAESDDDNENHIDDGDDDGSEDFLTDRPIPPKKRPSLTSNNSLRYKKIKKIERNDTDDSFSLDGISDVELKAIGANVVCKLKRMSSDQRCQAELLINKVLYHGLRNNLTSNTDVAEVEHDRSVTQD